MFRSDHNACLSTACLGNACKQCSIVLYATCGCFFDCCCTHVIHTCDCGEASRLWPKFFCIVRMSQRSAPTNSHNHTSTLDGTAIGVAPVQVKCKQHRSYRYCLRMRYLQRAVCCRSGTLRTQFECITEAVCEYTAARPVPTACPGAVGLTCPPTALRIYDQGKLAALLEAKGVSAHPEFFEPPRCGSRLCSLAHRLCCACAMQCNSTGGHGTDTKLHYRTPTQIAQTSSARAGIFEGLDGSFNLFLMVSLDSHPQWATPSLALFR